MIYILERLFLVVLSVLLVGYSGVAAILLSATLDTSITYWNKKKWFTIVIGCSLFIVLSGICIYKIYKRLKG